MIANANKFDAEYARPCFNHPHDPRTEEDPDGDAMVAMRDALSDCQQWLLLADSALDRGNWPHARLYLTEARSSLDPFFGEAQ